jgi:hypothetical protein
MKLNSSNFGSNVHRSDCFVVFTSDFDKPSTLAYEMAKREYGEIYSIFNADVASCGSEICSMYGVTKIPTILFFKDGVVISRMDSDEVLNFMEHSY